MADKRTDGQSVVVTLTDTQSKGDIVYLDGFAVVLMDDGVSGDQVAGSIEQAVFEFQLEEELTVDVGDLLYIDYDSVISDTPSGSNVAFAKVVEVNADNVVEALWLPQTTPLAEPQS